jgi:hypothetical protein
VENEGRKKNSHQDIDHEAEPARSDVLDDPKFFQLAHTLTAVY